MDSFISYYQLILIPLWPVLWDYKVPIFEVPIMGTFTNSDGCMYRAATGGINLLKESPGDKPAMQNNTRSHELGSSSSPDPMSIVVFSAIGFTGMGNPKAALECKPGAAVVLIRPADGHESPRLPPAQ